MKWMFLNLAALIFLSNNLFAQNNNWLANAYAANYSDQSSILLSKDINENFTDFSFNKQSFLLEEEKANDKKRKYMKIAGYSLLSVVALGGGMTSFGLIKMKRRNENFSTQVDDQVSGSDITLMGTIIGTLGLSTSLPLILKSRKKKNDLSITPME